MSGNAGDAGDFSIEARYLPPILREIVALIGLPATLTLVRHHGGTQLYVPVKFDPDHPLVKALGHSAAAALIEVYGGREHFDIPKGEIAIKAARDARMRAERDVFTRAQLALRYNLTERQIRNILGPDEDDRQMGMFEGAS